MTKDQRAARLPQMRQSKQQRVASMTEDQRASKLLQMRQSKQQRISSQTTQQSTRFTHDQETALLDQPAEPVMQCHIFATVLAIIPLPEEHCKLN